VTAAPAIVAQVWGALGSEPSGPQRPGDDPGDPRGHSDPRTRLLPRAAWPDQEGEHHIDHADQQDQQRVGKELGAVLEPYRRRTRPAGSWGSGS